MIQIGFTDWRQSNHPSIQAYSRSYCFVEIDNSYHSMPLEKELLHLVSITPAHFSFIVRAHHDLIYPHTPSKEFVTPHSFRSSLACIKNANKLKAVLFQYPASFTCNKSNVDQLRETKKNMGDCPCAIELNHDSWFTANRAERTLRFIHREGWIHSIVEPLDLLLPLLPLPQTDFYIIRTYELDSVPQLKEMLPKLLPGTKEICIIVSAN